MLTSDIELTLETYIVIPTSTGLPEHAPTDTTVAYSLQCIIFVMQSSNYSNSL